jgi:DMSO/TMAO reductase YedYZ molybdopterin-dependent catalytic subunit
MLDTRYNGWKISEVYTHTIMTNREDTNYTGWSCVDKNSKSPKVQNLTLGGCTGFPLKLDNVQTAKETSYVMFHSADRAYPLNLYY